MFCKKCGNQLDENSKFCNVCGTSVDDLKDTYSEESEPNFHSINNLNIANEFFSPLGNNNNVKLFISALVLLVLNPILSLFDSIKVSENLTGYKMISEKISVFDFLFDLAKDLSFIYFLIVIGILGIVCAGYFMLLPLIKKTSYQKKNFTALKIMSVIALLFIILFYILVFSTAKKEVYVNVGLTFTGWLLLIDSIALVLVSFKTAATIIKKEGI